MQRYSKDYYMQLKLGDIFRIDIKNHDILLEKNIAGVICGDTL